LRIRRHQRPSLQRAQVPGVPSCGPARAGWRGVGGQDRTALSASQRLRGQVVLREAPPGRYQSDARGGLVVSTAAARGRQLVPEQVGRRGSALRAFRSRASTLTSPTSSRWPASAPRSPANWRRSRWDTGRSPRDPGSGPPDQTQFLPAAERAPAREHALQGRGRRSDGARPPRRHVGIHETLDRVELLTVRTNELLARLRTAAPGNALEGRPLGEQAPETVLEAQSGLDDTRHAHRRPSSSL